MRDEVEEAEDNKVEVRKDDKTISPFTIEFENFVGPIVTINNLTLMDPKTANIVHRKLDLTIKKGERYILK
jgi:hypothetical protein